MGSHLFPIDNGKYRLVFDLYQDWSALQLQYREYVVGTPFTMTPDGVDMPEGTAVLKDAAERLWKDIIENVSDTFDEGRGVVVFPGGHYRLKKPKAIITSGPLATTKLFETFYRWAPHEFKGTMASFTSGVNESVPILGLELVPIKDGQPIFEEARIVEADKL